MNEAGLNARWIRADMTDPKTQQFAKDVLNHMRERLSDYQEMYDNELYNLEATPAESTAFRLAKHDRKRYLYHVFLRTKACHSRMHLFGMHVGTVRFSFTYHRLHTVQHYIIRYVIDQ